MPSNPNSTSNPNTSPKDNQSAEIATESLRASQQRRAERTPEAAARYFKNARESQEDFAKRLLSIRASGGSMSAKEFEMWEDDFTTWWDIAQDEMSRGNLDFNARAEAEQHVVTSTDDSELYKTIEAQAGNFYFERTKALREAILASDPKTAEQDLAYLNAFPGVVARHLDFKYMTREEIIDYGPSEQDRQRTAAHNEVIRHLNGLNDLARKYGTRPFTVRNFWPSDERRKTQAVQKVMRYDRDIVEEYYAIAFSGEVRKREAEQERFRRYGVY